MSDADAVQRWRDDLAAWAIPQRILDAAPMSPWSTERAVFIRRAVDRTRSPRGNSYRRAYDALATGGTVLDVGAGAGAASLQLLDRASALVAVDQDAELLRELVQQAGARAATVRTIVGSWPNVASEVPEADVVVCHHVLYNVPDLEPFITALDAHARRRVVIELTAQHPVAWLNPLWERFHGLARPTRPTALDAAHAIESLRGPVQIERERMPVTGDPGPWPERVAFACRRLCLAPDRLAEVAAALQDLGVRPDDPATWSAANREVVTIWWER